MLPVKTMPSSVMLGETPTALSPPPFAPLTAPLVTVMPESVSELAKESKMRRVFAKPVASRRIVSSAAPGPVIVSGPLIC